MPSPHGSIGYAYVELAAEAKRKERDERKKKEKREKKMGGSLVTLAFRPRYLLATLYRRTVIS